MRRVFPSFHFFFLPACGSDSNREQLVQAGGVPVFIKLLESRDTDVQFYSAAALSNLSVHRKCIVLLFL